MKRNYEVSYTVTYRIIVAAYSETDAKNKASNADSYEWDDSDASEYTAEELYDEPDDT